MTHLNMFLCHLLESTVSESTNLWFHPVEVELGDVGSWGGRRFNLSLKHKRNALSSRSLIPVSNGVSICDRLKMKEMESKGVASDQINGESLMRFVKQCRSRSWGVQSRLSKLGLRGWQILLIWNPAQEKKIPSLFSWFLIPIYMYIQNLICFTHLTQKK